MLENQMFNYVSHLNRLLQWLADKISVHYDLPRVKVKLKPFKMADDVERKSVAIRAADAGLISKHTLLAEFGYNYEEEFKKILKEQEDMAKLLMLQQQLQIQAIAKQEEEQQNEEDEEPEGPNPVMPPRSQAALIE